MTCYISLYVLLKFGLCKSVFLTRKSVCMAICLSYSFSAEGQKETESESPRRDTIFGKERNFSNVYPHIRESESVAHTRRTNTPTKEQNERPHRNNGVVFVAKERKRERITISERVCDDDNDAKFIRLRSSMRFDDLFVGEAEGNNNNIDENESY